MSEPDFEIVTTCMGRLEHLRESLPHMAAQPGCRVTVVDWSCPQGCGAWVRDAFPAVRVVDVPGQDRFSIARARNAGALGASAPWLCFVDADVLLEDGFAAALRERVESGRYWVAEPVEPPLAGTVVCARADFERIGGYDEVIEGWGCEDRDLYVRLAFAGAARAGFPARLTGVIAHDDADRTRHHADRDRRRSHARNRLYVQVKHDLMRMGGRTLDERERGALYASVGQCIDRVPAGDGSATMEVPLLSEELSPEYLLRGGLSYRISHAARRSRDD